MVCEFTCSNPEDVFNGSGMKAYTKEKLVTGKLDLNRPGIKPVDKTFWKQVLLFAKLRMDCILIREIENDLYDPFRDNDLCLKAGLPLCLPE